MITIESDDEKEVEALAEEEIERALNLLRFYLAGLSDHNPFFYKMYMGIEGTSHTGFTGFLTVHEEIGKYSTFSERRGSVYDYEITELKLKQMKENGFAIASEMLSKSDTERNEFQNNIMTAIDFFGTGMNELSYRNAFVNFVIALDSALLERCQKHKAQNITNGISALFNVRPSDRKTLFDEINGHYAIRSDIVHEGIDNVSEEVVTYMCYLAFNTIARLIPYCNLVENKKGPRKQLHQTLKESNRKAT